MSSTNDKNAFMAAMTAVENSQTDRKLRYAIFIDEARGVFSMINQRIASNSQKFIKGLNFSAPEIGMAITIRDALNQAYSDGIADGQRTTTAAAS